MFGACDHCGCYCKLREETRKWLEKANEGYYAEDIADSAIRLLQRWADS